MAEIIAICWGTFTVGAMFGAWWAGLGHRCECWTCEAQRHD